MPYETTWKDRLADAKANLGPIIAGVIVLAVGGWVTWKQLSPGRKVAKLERAATTDETARAALRALVATEVDTLEKSYRRALETDATKVDLEKLLDRLIAKQREAIKLTPTPVADQSDRLAQFEAMRGTLRAGTAAARSVVLEEEGLRARKSGQEAVAVEKLREALRLQRAANADAPASELKDLPREARLAAALEEADAEPLHTAVEVSRTLAIAAVARGAWSEATRAYKEARTAQAELNRNFPSSRHADAAALDRFDTEIASIAAAGLAATVATREREGERAAAAGWAEDAAKAFTEAMDLQREINRNYPRSRGAAPARLDELTVRRDTALSAAALAKVVELADEATGMLRGRDVAGAIGKVGEAAALRERTEAAFPRSRTLDPALRLKLDFLAVKRADLPALQEQVYARLVRGAGDVDFCNTEVSQELYTRVMNTNPSRNVGRLLPVDSVSWHDAQEFCQRLSWVLGRRVRLPTEAEFRALFSGGASAPWSADSADGHSHEVGRSVANAAGVFDLAGNLAEWLQGGNEADEKAMVAGGSYLDPAEALRGVPVVAAEKRERARHVGFRFVVERPVP